MRLWHPLIDEAELERVVDIAGERASLELTLTRGLHPAPLTGRPHSWAY